MSGVAMHLDALRVALGETGALAAITAESYDRQDWMTRTRSTSSRWPACSG